MEIRFINIENDSRILSTLSQHVPSVNDVIYINNRKCKVSRSEVHYNSLLGNDFAEIIVREID